MPSRAEHMRLLSEIQASEPVSLTAFKAARGPAPEQASKALQLAKDRGVSPQFAADNAEAMQQQDRPERVRGRPRGRPVLASYAGQSACTRPRSRTTSPRCRRWRWASPTSGTPSKARKYMDATPEERAKLEDGPRDYEQAAQRVRGSGAGVLADVARAVPNVAAYGASAVLGATGKSAVAGTMGMGAAMYQLNRGVLFRRIVEQFPDARKSGARRGPRRLRCRIRAVAEGVRGPAGWRRSTRRRAR
jgi:hypothetical protein